MKTVFLIFLFFYIEFYFQLEQMEQKIYGNINYNNNGYKYHYSIVDNLLMKLTSFALDKNVRLARRARDKAGKGKGCQGMRIQLKRIFSRKELL